MGLTLDPAHLRRIAEDQGLSPEMAPLWATTSNPAFPGAVLPVLSPSDGLIIYAAADSQAEWRKLQPLLLAYAGPLLTDFAGAPAPLDLARSFDAALAASGVAVVTALRPGRFMDADRAVLRSLLRLQDRLSVAPNLVTPGPKATSRLLAELQDGLNVGDLSAASDALAILRGELRLDAANLARLEMQILAAGGQWSAVRWHPRFETLVYGGPPPETANLLLDAIYRVQVAGADPAELETRRATVTALAATLLLRVTTPLNLTAQLLQDWLRAPTEEPGPAEADGDLASDVPNTDRAQSRGDAKTETAALTPAESARSVLMAVMGASDEAYIISAIAAYDVVGALTEAERAEVLGRPVFLAIWDELRDRLGHQRPPANWTDWLLRLDDPSFDASGVAANGQAWILGPADIDPAEAQRMSQAILDTPAGLATDRLAEGLPFLVAWAQADARWPRSALRSVYLALLTAMAISGRSGDALLKSAAPLLDGALRSGLSPAEYNEAIDAAGEIARAGLNRNSVYEILELAETARGASAANPATLQDFTISILNDISSHATRLTAGQKLAVSALAEEAGWAHPLLSAPPVRPPDEGEDPLTRLEVGIYTLTEGAGRSAQTLLQSYHPGIRITLNHDHGGTSGLAALAQRADLFVIAWGSAAHAATDFIRDKRNGPIIYAAGKGASSLIRAVEEVDLAVVERARR